MPVRFTLPDELKPPAPSAPTPRGEFAYGPMLQDLGADNLPTRIQALVGAGLQEWLAAAQDRWRVGAQDEAEAMARATMDAFPGEAEAVLEYAAVLRVRGKSALAEEVLRAHADKMAVALVLAEILRDRGAFDAACQLVVRGLREEHLERDLRWQGCVFLESCARQDLALESCERRIAAGYAEPDDLANAARLAMQVGRFDLARSRYEQALSAGLDPGLWKVAEALATCQRYADPGHPDIALFKDWLQRPGMDDAARADVFFALAKASDDLAHYRDAAKYWRNANALMLAGTRWDAAGWQSLVDGQITRFWARVRKVRQDWVPVFVVGMPRSGTTLVAQLLASHGGVRNRGELMFIPQLSTQISERAAEQDATSLEEAAEYYRKMVVRDDAPARWYIDKQTFNFQHLGLIAALFPQAHVVYCTRDPRDTALSVWAQNFGAGGPSFIYDLDAIADVTRGCRRLIHYWSNSLPLPIHTIAYEELVASAGDVVTRLCDAIGIDSGESARGDAGSSASNGVINTASMWQVRQPISASGVGRWRNYAEFIPELVTKFADFSST